MKKLVKMLAMLLALSLVVGLAGTAAAADVEIHYAFWHGALEEFYNQCKADFEAANPGVKIILEPTSWDEYWTKLEAAATGGSIADVFHMNGVNIKKYADGGVLMPLDDLIAKGRLAIVNVYPDADLTEWRSYAPIYPKNWYNGYNGDLDVAGGLYNLRAIPSLYVLDENKNVVFKDVDPVILVQYLNSALAAAR